MATFCLCQKHLVWYDKGKRCPKCEADDDSSKKSEKYGGVGIVIPPHMRSVPK